MRHMTFIVMLLTCSSIFGDSTTRPAQNPGVLMGPDGIHLSAILRLDKHHIRAGELVTMRLSLENHGVSVRLFNPFLYARIALPADIVATGVDGSELGGLVGSRSSVGAGHWSWVYFPPSSQIGSTRERSLALVPGTYNVQFVFFKSFLNSELPANATREDFSRFEEYLDRGELFRSNAVRIRVVP